MCRKTRNQSFHRNWPNSASNSLQENVVLSFEMPTKLKSSSKFVVVSPEKLSIKANEIFPAAFGSVQSN
ncbi:hypothetical protein LINPERPRIM_LOCUS35225 [Linum perenne]